jgi:beta-lactam-binding protein with PASTA domain
MALKIGKLSKETLIRLGIMIGTFVGAGLILLVLADTIIMPTWTRQGSETEVPNIVDLSYQAAEARLKDANLDVVKGTEEYDPTRPKGMVINQVPEGGTKVKTGRRVVLTLSKGSASAQVPILEGYTLREARLMLEKEGLHPGVITWFENDSLPDGVILGSIPPRGTVMKLNADVQLIVNRVETEMMVRVPNFVGQDLEKARELAEENYLLIGEINYAVNEKLLPETVMAQSTPRGISVRKWSTIDLTVSSME